MTKGSTDSNKATRRWATTVTISFLTEHSPTEDNVVALNDWVRSRIISTEHPVGVSEVKWSDAKVHGEVPPSGLMIVQH